MTERSEPASDAVTPEVDDHIRLVRLVTGEDILCVMRDDLEGGTWQPMDTVILSTPLKLVMHRLHPLRPTSPLAIGIMQWLPDELLECHAVAVKVGHIVTIMEPKEELKQFYTKTVDMVQTKMILGDKDIRGDITSASIDSGRTPASANTPSLMETINNSRMQELMHHLNDLDEYLMSQTDEDGPITYH